MSISFLNLLTTDPRIATSPIGWRNGMAVGRAEFVARIHDWQAALATQAGQSFALSLDDSIEFAAALLGLWYAGKTVRLCADIQPASIAALRGSVDGFVGSFPADCGPLQIGDVRAAAGDPHDPEGTLGQHGDGVETYGCVPRCGLLLRARQRWDAGLQPVCREFGEHAVDDVHSSLKEVPELRVLAVKPLVLQRQYNRRGAHRCKAGRAPYHFAECSGRMEDRDPV